MKETNEPGERFLPLRPNWFHILVSLADSDRHGYGIMQEVEQRTSGEVHLWPATLYGSIKKMLEEGLIEAAGDRPDAADDDPRRRYYAISDVGLEVLRCETRRLEALVAGARAKSAVGHGDHTA
jgi:DNA-binding PadR family transcriptional regulator